MAVTNVFGTGWLGFPTAPDFWSMMETVFAMVRESVRGRSAVGGAELEDWDQVSGMDAGEKSFAVERETRRRRGKRKGIVEKNGRASLVFVWEEKRVMITNNANNTR